MGRKRSLLETAKQQEAESLELEQEYSRDLAGEPAREEAERAKIQGVLDAIARVEFGKMFGLKPAAVGESSFNNVYGRFSVPIFAVEYAQLRFQPGEYTTHWIKYPGGWKLDRSIGASVVASIIKLLKPDTRKYEDYTMASEGCQFEAVGLCSGCNNWGNLGHLEAIEWPKSKRILHVRSPEIRKFDDLARNIELFNEASSGLALDCGTLNVFGFKPEEQQVVIQCQNMLQSIETENGIHGPSKEEMEANTRAALRSLYRN